MRTLARPRRFRADCRGCDYHETPLVARRPQAKGHGGRGKCHCRPGRPDRLGLRDLLVRPARHARTSGKCPLPRYCEDRPEIPLPILGWQSINAYSLLPPHCRQVLLQKPAQVAGEIGRRAELQPDHVDVRPLAVQLGIVAQVGDLSQREAALGAHQVQVHRVELLGLHGRPGLVLLGHVDRHHLLVVPEELALGRGLGQQLAAAPPALRRPTGSSCRAESPCGRSATCGRAPSRACRMSGFCLHPLGELAEAGDRPVDELPELRPVDLLVAVHAQLDLLPRPAEVLALAPAARCRRAAARACR